MPKAMEDALKRVARARGYGKERAGAFIYGTMRKTGWKPKLKKLPKRSKLKLKRKRK